jgi:hypothetical protein
MNTSKVENMSSMFKNCDRFSGNHGMYNPTMAQEWSQSNITIWDVSKVENMDNMFEGCRSFHTDLHEWNITLAYNNNHVRDMFTNCGRMSTPNLYPGVEIRPYPYPNLVRNIPQVANPITRHRNEDAFGVHNASEGIVYDELADLLRGQLHTSSNKEPDIPSAADFGDYILDKLNKLIVECNPRDPFQVVHCERALRWCHHHSNRQGQKQSAFHL